MVAHASSSRRFSLRFSPRALASTVGSALGLLALLGCDPAGDETEPVSGVGEYFGDETDETVEGTDEGDTLVGGDGDDVIRGLGGDDVIYGGLGDQLTNAEGRETGNDELDGGPGNDQVVGEQGDDIVRGGADDDVLSGSEGDDTLEGGPGADSFIYLLVIDRGGAWRSDATSGGRDVISDFEPGADVLLLFNRFDEAFTNPTREQLDAAFGRAEAGFVASSAGDDLVLSFTGGDTLTFTGLLAGAEVPQTLEELEAQLGGSGAIVYGAS